MAATSVAFNKLFEDNERATGEKVPKSMQLLIPANMRFGMYRTADTVKMENKFAALPLKMPLIKDMSFATKIQKVTKKMKNVGMIYASYAATLYTTIFGPRMLPRLFTHVASMKFSCAFSNVPGPVKAFKFSDPSGNRAEAKWCQSYVICAGRVGLAVTCISYDKTFHIAVIADDGITKESKNIVKMIDNNILSEIERMKDMPVPTSSSSQISAETKKNK